MAPVERPAVHSRLVLCIRSRLRPRVPAGFDLYYFIVPFKVDKAEDWDRHLLTIR
jgi:hypothetical protein